MASLARLVSGEWRVTFVNRKSQIDRWRWGPGEHSMRALTDSSEGDGESTSGVCRVLYWHPGRKQIVLLGLFKTAVWRRERSRCTARPRTSTTTSTTSACGVSAAS